MTQIENVVVVVVVVVDRKRALSTSEDSFEEMCASWLSTISQSHTFCMCWNSDSGTWTPENLFPAVEVSCVSSSESLKSCNRRMEFWSDSVDAVKAIKAEGARFIEHLIPKPPVLTGRLACGHWTPSRSIFQIFEIFFENYIQFIQERVTAAGWSI